MVKNVSIWAMHICAAEYSLNCILRCVVSNTKQYFILRGLCFCQHLEGIDKEWQFSIKIVHDWNISSRSKQILSRFSSIHHEFRSFVCLWFTQNTDPISAAFIQQRTEKRSVFYVLPFDIEMILIATASCSMFIFSRLFQILKCYKIIIWLNLFVEVDNYVNLSAYFSGKMLTFICLQRYYRCTLA